MGEPKHFREWVRQITISVFEIGGQPLPVDDMHTLVNIVTFFAIMLNKIFYVLFKIIHSILKVQHWVKKNIRRYFIEIIIGSCLCILAAQTDSPIIINYSFNFFNTLPYLCWILMSSIGNFLISWTSYYLLHFIMIGTSYIAFQIFMSFMRHVPAQTETL
jgi:hypothetical protein